MGGLPATLSIVPLTGALSAGRTIGCRRRTSGCRVPTAAGVARARFAVWLTCHAGPEFVGGVSVSNILSVVLRGPRLNRHSECRETAAEGSPVSAVAFPPLRSRLGARNPVPSAWHGPMRVLWRRRPARAVECAITVVSNRYRAAIGVAHPQSRLRAGAGQPGEVLETFAGLTKPLLSATRLIGSQFGFRDPL